MKRSPGVYFRCVTCGWRQDVPERFVVLDGGLPRSAVTYLHTCPDGAPDVEERGYFDAELVTTAPMHNWTMKL